MTKEAFVQLYPVPNRLNPRVVPLASAKLTFPCDSGQRFRVPKTLETGVCCLFATPKVRPKSGARYQHIPQRPARLYSRTEHNAYYCNNRYDNCRSA